jgi:SPOR domain
VNPGGMKIDGAENDVFSGGTDTANSKLAPSPENPDAKALRTAAAAPPPVVNAPAPPVATPPSPTAKQAAAAVRPSSPRQVVGASPSAAVPAPGASAKPQMAATETHPLAPGHEAMVQFAALTTEEAARDEWRQLSKRMPDLLNQRRPVLSRTEHDGHVFWRLRTAGFADVAQARGFCDRVRAKGGGCSVADF